jgi:hypothetical protein
LQESEFKVPEEEHIDSSRYVLSVLVLPINDHGVLRL